MDFSRELLDSLGVVVWEMDSCGLNLIAISDRVEPMFGYPASRWLDESASFLNFVHAEDRRRVLEALTGAVERCSGDPVEFRVIASDARVRWVRSTIRAASITSGAHRLGGTMTDVTEWHELQQREHRYRAMVANSADAIALLDRDGTIRFVTESVERISGYTAAELTGRNAFEQLHPDDRPYVRDAFLSALAQPGVPLSVEYRARHKDGSWHHREVAGVNRLDDPDVASIVVSYRDTTARRRAEAALAEHERTHQPTFDEALIGVAQQQVRQAHKMEAIGRLAGGIAHDFNNLLTAIVGYADLALQQLSAAEKPVRDDIEEIRAASKRAASLTGQLLAFGRRQVLQPQIVDLNMVVVKMKGLLSRLIGEQIDVRWRLANSLDRVSAEPGQIEQVVLNLALNARDAMPQGGTLSIETSNVELDAAYTADHSGATIGPHVMLAISDTGAGIDDGVREHLFEPFYTTKELGQGTGLGLATVYGIVKQSGGSIFVYSEPGHGTTCKIFLPRVDRVADVIEAPLQPPVTLDGTETVVVVEDQSEVRSVVRETLRRHGYTVVEAANGQEALAAAARRSGPIHLLLTDVVMPGMSGPDLAGRFVRDLPEVRVLYMSGYAHDGVEQREMLEPGAAFLQKPFPPDVLLRRVREVLSSA